MHHGRSVDLRDAGLHYAQDEADFFHRGFFIVIKGHDQAFALRKVTDRLRQPFPHLGMQVAKERIVFRPIWQIDQLFFSGVF